MTEPKNGTRMLLSEFNSTGEAVYLTSGSGATKCLHCTLDFESVIVGCPVRCVETRVEDSKHSERNHDGEYFTVGRFCSYNCATAYAIERSHNPLFRNSCRYINIVASKLFESPTIVVPSPPKEFLRCFGGYMTPEQYQSEIGKVRYDCKGTTITHPLTLVYSRKLTHM